MYRYSQFLGCFFLLLLSIATTLSAYPQRPQQNRSNEDIQIYNENYYPNYGQPQSYGYYSGYPPIPTPDEAFPDDAEAERLFQNLHD